ncbi:TN [Mytilus edulis]|uniref:TN n=1 Tax=Mytilus edulis TaxID=6550 RepID=A0A8S3SMD9_MYTED|nr:TN [Mytilus edulis]
MLNEYSSKLEKSHTRYDQKLSEMHSEYDNRFSDLSENQSENVTKFMENVHAWQNTLMQSMNEYSSKLEESHTRYDQKLAELYLEDQTSQISKEVITNFTDLKTDMEDWKNDKVADLIKAVSMNFTQLETKMIDGHPKRFNGVTEFYRNWQDYEKGFGDLNEEFWLGDSMTYHNNMPFSTYDRDNDKSSSNCADYSNMKGAWWYNSCWRSSLNGKYSNSSSLGGIKYEAWRGYYKALQSLQ